MDHPLKQYDRTYTLDADLGVVECKIVGYWKAKDGHKYKVGYVGKTETRDGSLVFTDVVRARSCLPDYLAKRIKTTLRGIAKSEARLARMREMLADASQPDAPSRK